MGRRRMTGAHMAAARVAGALKPGALARGTGVHRRCCVIAFSVADRFCDVAPSDAVDAVKIGKSAREA